MQKIISILILIISINLRGDMKLNSLDFKNNDYIDEKFTCQGKNEAPRLSWQEVPSGTESFVLIVDDPDAPQKEPFVHWVLYNIPASVRDLVNQLGHKEITDDGTQGVNSLKKIGYDGPCPPKGNFHHYIFNLYALDKVLDLNPGAGKSEVLKAIEGSVLSRAQLIGIYKLK